MSPQVQTQERQEAVGFKRILIATDFSDASQRAHAWALAIARRYGAVVYLVHAIPPEVREMPMEPLPKDMDRGWTEAERHMKGLADDLRTQHIASQTLLTRGSASTVITSAIRDENIDLLVLGTHGRGGFKKLILGSVAEELVRIAPCPVLTIGRHVEPMAPFTLQLRQVLFATDFGPAAAQALRYALFLAEERSARLILLHMIPPMPTPDLGPGSFCPPDYTAAQLENWEATQRQTSDRKLKAILPPETKLSVEPEYVVANDILPDGILTVAAEYKADLIAMGANRTGFVRAAAHIPGSTVHHVISEAKCPVLTFTA